MEISDFFRLSEWPKRQYLIINLSIILGYIGAIITDRYIFNLMIIPQLLGFIVFTFLPGFAILRILRIFNIDRVAVTLLIVGLSMFFNTIFGFVLNELFKNFIKPISDPFLQITYLFGLLILIYISGYYVDYEIYLSKITIHRSDIILLIIPIFAIISILVFNYFGLNILVIITFVIISVIPFLYMRCERHHAFIIWITSISILLSYHLVSSYLWSWDIHSQYYIANMIKNQGYWDVNIPQKANSLLTIVLLAPIYSILLNLNLIWIYKIIYPFFFSLVPVGIYYFTKDVLKDDTIAFLSPFIFMFYYGFFKDMVDKQFIAELFLILSLITIINQNSKIRKLSVAFIIMLPMSHYGVSALFLGSIFFTSLLIYIEKINIKNIIDLSLFPLTNIAIFMAVIVFSWYLYTSGERVFEVVTSVGLNTITHIGYYIFSPEFRSGIHYLNLPTPNIIWKIFKILNFAFLLLIIIGVIGFTLDYRKIKDDERKYVFYLISIFFLVFLALQSFITFHLGMDRALQISLTVLSPFSVLGYRYLIVFFGKFHSNIKNFEKKHLTLLSAYLCFLFLFNSGVVHQLSGDPLPYSVSLNKNPGWCVYSLDEVASVKWIKINGLYSIAVYNPYHIIKSRDGILLSGYYSPEELLKTPNIPFIVNSSSENYQKIYFFITKYTIEKKLTIRDRNIMYSKMEKIYSSPHAMVYLKR